MMRWLSSQVSIRLSHIRPVCPITFIWFLGKRDREAMCVCGSILCVSVRSSVKLYSVGCECYPQSLHADGSAKGKILLLSHRRWPCSSLPFRSTRRLIQSFTTLVFRLLHNIRVTCLCTVAYTGVHDRRRYIFISNKPSIAVDLQKRFTSWSPSNHRRHMMILTCVYPSYPIPIPIPVHSHARIPLSQ